MKGSSVSFSHVQLYVDYVEDVSIYKALEEKLNKFSSRKIGDRAAGKDFWKSIASELSDPATELSFQPQRRDVVKQLLAGFGFRVTGARMSSSTVQTNTRTVLVTSHDPRGVQFIVSSLARSPTCKKDEFHHFDAVNLRKFYSAHAKRQGCAVLAFEVTSVENIYQSYTMKHPKLVLRQCNYENVKVLEVYAYYMGDTNVTDADVGTILRFVEVKHYKPEGELCCPLPGLSPLEATFDDSSQAAYCDHWVSNVNSRISFLKTLEDTLGFLPKVDFNAGVVAAGEAQIESTVTGNESFLSTSKKDRALRDQSQVYLPINNALSDVGHVHGFLKEIGQGVQHVASRVENLIEFVQRANDYREMIGEGFTFLQIPRSYYGILSKKDLFASLPDTKSSRKKDDPYCSAKLSEECAEAVLDACERSGIVSQDFAVDLYMSPEEIDHMLESKLTGCFLEEYRGKKKEVVTVILRSRYANLYNLLRDNLSEKSYVGIVRNQILVDVQGEDLLYQIFTSNILQRNIGEEAPFFEFIQRVCSECQDENGCPVKIKPGCGGFGIRNFLTLFLSIEVSKAMTEVSQAKSDKDEVKQKYAQQMVDCFTNQLNESNPILTEISDAMTAEGNYNEYMQTAMEEDDGAKVSYWRSKMEAAANAKRLGNVKLMECSAKYKDLMKTIRERSITAK